jgi:N-acetylglucosamine-6-phosphate deacetylase
LNLLKDTPVNTITFINANVILEDRIIPRSSVTAEHGFITAIGANTTKGEVVDLNGKFLSPGFVELHVHGGNGADFMDLSQEAFQTVCKCHIKHGTTSLTPTSTVANEADYKRFLEICQMFVGPSTGGSRILGGHLYGPYFHPEAKGCHPNLDFLTPDPERDAWLWDYANNGLTTLTIAPETPGTEELVRKAREYNLLVTAGHSYATFEQVEQAVEWGVRHVDHLFCAMSDRARLRQSQAFPMRAGVMEATLYHDELTTEVIADGWHLSPELLKFAYKMKGPDRLAIVSDSMRAVDLPDGEYWFGPPETGERVRREGDVGVTLDGKGLASGVMGQDHGVRVFHQQAGVPLVDVIKMASLTPARILRRDNELGSIAFGKRADLVVLNSGLIVQQVYLNGTRMV